MTRRSPAPSESSSWPFWALDVDDLLRGLGTSRAGLSPAGVEQKTAAVRRLHSPTRNSAWSLLARQFKNPIVVLLLASAAVSMAFADVIEALIIMAIVALSGLLGFVQEHGAVRAIDELMRSVQVGATVLRDGRSLTVHLADVVTGDVVLLDAGSVVPGDCRVLEANALLVDEAALTGESYPRHKEPSPVAATAPLGERRNALWFGTHVASGTGTAVVVATGADTTYGTLVAHLGRQHVPTAFERGITSYGMMLVRATVVLVTGVFIANVVLHRPLVESLLFSLALAVGLTPQMLPAIVTLSLSVGARQLARQKVVVKRLDSIEDFGSLTVLCTDKTGTLSQGEVSFVGGVDVSGAESQRVVTLGSWNACLQGGFDNPMDAAVATGADVAALPRKLAEIPFDFSRKMVSVVVDDCGPLIVTKGAVTRVLERCTLAVTPGGEAHGIVEVREAIERRALDFASSGLRVLALATARPARVERYDVTDEKGLTFEGFLLFGDPTKPQARAAVARLSALGIRTKLITGDSAAAATFTARDVGLGDGVVLVGSDLAAMDDVELRRRVGEVDIYADVDPLQKERVIRALSDRGETVGFLGDGINDAAALHVADVGISVDDAVDVAKRSADLVLLDKDLEVLAEGVRQGRKVFRNTLKYVHVTTSANFGNMLSLALATLFLPYLPLLPLQVLLLNFLSDIPGMTIATDRVDGELLQRPARWNIVSLQRFMIVFGLVSTVADLTTFLLLRGILDVGPEVLRTGWFVESVLTELAVLLSLRTARPLWRSRPGPALGLSSAAVAGVTVGIVYSPVARSLGFAALGVSTLAALLGVALGYVAVTEAVKAAWPSLLDGSPPRSVGGPRWHG